jgi:hypothetical protein
MVDDDIPVDTLGVRLQHMARTLISARMVTYPWVEALSQVFEHIASMPAADRRFDRFESDIYGIVAPLGRPAAVASRETASAAEAANGGTRAPGDPISTDVHARLRALTGAEIPQARVHRNSAADAVARAHRADAVTYGNDIYFRQNRFAPHERYGFALLAHEATHVAHAQRQKARGQRSTGSGNDEQEAAASATEIAARIGAQRIDIDRRDVRGLRSAAPHSAPLAPTFTDSQLSVAPAVSAVSAAATPSDPGAGAVPPMAAASDRDLTPSSGAFAAVDMEALRRWLMQDLKEQLRTEFERGG